MVKLFSNPHHLIFWEGHVWAHRRNVCTQSTPELKLKLKTYQSIYQKMHVRAHARDQSVLCLISYNLALSVCLSEMATCEISIHVYYNVCPLYIPYYV